MRDTREQGRLDYGSFRDRRHRLRDDGRGTGRRRHLLPARHDVFDFVTAHKWFNLAAMRGSAEAIRLRREIADQMSEAEIAQAQRAARAWLKAS